MPVNDKLVEPNGVSRSGSVRPSNATNGNVFFNDVSGSLEVFDETGAANGYHASSGVVAQQVNFTETTAAGVYTGAIAVPAGAIVLDVVVYGEALWSAGTSATMNVGDTGNASGYYTGVNLKATDLLAGEALSFAQSGGKAGAYNVGTNTHWTNRYYPTGDNISGVITTVGTGATGKTRMVVVYALPRVKTATKV